MTEDFKEIDKTTKEPSIPLSLQERAWEVVNEYKKSLHSASHTRDEYSYLLSELQEREPRSINEYLAKFLLQERNEIESFITSGNRDTYDHFSLYEIIFQKYAGKKIFDGTYPELKVATEQSKTIKLLKSTFSLIRNNELDCISLNDNDEEDYNSYIDYRFSDARQSLGSQPLSSFFKEATVLPTNGGQLKLNIRDLEYIQKSIISAKKIHAEKLLLYLAILSTHESKKVLQKQHSKGSQISTFIDTVIFDLLKKDVSQMSEVGPFNLPQLSFSKYPELLKATKHIFNAQIRKYSTLAENSPTDVTLQITKEEQDEKLKLHKQKPLLRRIVNFLEMKEEKLNITNEQKETIEKLLSSLNSIVTLWNIGHTYAEKSEFEDQQDYGRFLMASAKLVMDGLRRNLINLEIALQNKNISYEFASLDQDLAGIEDKLRADQNVAIGLLDGLRTSLEINNKISSEGNS